MQKFKGIARRWYISSFGIIAFLFFITVIISSVALRSYYYESVAMTLETHANDNVRSFFNLYTGGTEERFRTGARTFVENFEDKDKMEVWVIDSSGEPIISSNGFQPSADEPMPDYDILLLLLLSRSEPPQQLLAATGPPPPPLLGGGGGPPPPHMGPRPPSPPLLRPQEPPRGFLSSAGLS